MPPRHSRQAPQLRGPIAPVHRGPQAASTSPSVAAFPLHAPNAALLIDFDNVTMGVRSDLASELKNLLSSDIVKGKVSVQRAYADWRRYPQYIVPLSESSIDLIFAPAYGSSKKNATDIRLAIDALELVFTRPEIGTFILLSGDSDFSSLVIKLKEYGKYVIGVGIRESSSDLLVQNCDEYYSYNALAGLVNTREEEIVKWDPWELVAEAAQRMKRNGDVMRADRLKQVMQQIDSSFDEKNVGMSKFSRFVGEAAHRGIITLHKMESGQYEIDIPEPTEATEPAAVPAPAIKELPLETAPTAEERRGGRGRSRRGRGRGREREDRRPRGETESQPVAAAAESAAEPVAELPITQAPATLASEETVVADSIGVSGMRLTRDEAFDLVRRAVNEVATLETPARANDIRQAARDLLGRDSESLSVRNFTRILQDAHDADIVDLRRRGDDYEVTPAIVVAPITDQLGAAEAAAKPAPAPATAQLPSRGMGPRGIAPRGRKTVPLPPNLLSVGVVDDSLLDASNNEPATEPAASTLEPEPQPTSRRGRGQRRAAKKAATKTAPKNASATKSTPAPQSAAPKATGSKTAAKKATRKKTGSKTKAQ
jgi:uncharacterized protein (TIGR00288 family)